MGKALRDVPSEELMEQLHDDLRTITSRMLSAAGSVHSAEGVLLITNPEKDSPSAALGNNLEDASRLFSECSARLTRAQAAWEMLLSRMKGRRG